MPIDRDHQLKTERCILRHVSKEDIPHVFAATRFEGFNDGMTWDPPQELAASEIGAQCATWNAASRRVMEKTGMVWREQLPQGFKKGGHWIEVDRLSLMRGEWHE